MYIEPVPIFGAVTGGLSANYTINFALDLNHVIPLQAMWQGSPVKCKTLYIDNYTNSIPLRVTNGNSSQLVPQYSVGTVDISGFDDVILTAEGSCAVAMSVMSHASTKYGFDIRGALPASLTNDPYWANVVFLCHFNALTTSTTMIDTKSNNYNLTLFNYPSNTLSTSSPIFNETSLSCTINDSDNIGLTLGSTPSSSGFTFEVAYRPSSFIASNYNILFDVESGGANYSYIVALKIDGGGNATHISAGSNNGTMSLVDVAYSFTVGTTYFIAVDFISTTKALLYVNGTNIGEISGTMTAGTPSTVAKMASHRNMSGAKSALGTYDELRLTNYKRYTELKYDVQTAAFLNQ